MLVALLLVLHFILAAAMVAGLGWLALIPWRRSKEAHWTERARQLWPARVTSGMLLFSIPVALAGAQLIVLPDLPLKYLGLAGAGLLGAAVGMWPMMRAIFPRMQFQTWLRELATMVVIRLFTLGILVAAGLCMPSELNWSALPLAGGVLAMMLWSIYGGALQLLHAAGTLAQPSARLTTLVSEVAERMQLPMPKIWLLRLFGANALALPVLNTLLVTEGAMEALSDEELAAICAHEFAHLNEPKSVITARILAALAPLPAIFLKPAFHAWGPFGCVAIGAAMVITARLTRNFRNRMEQRADSMATDHEGASPGTYAGALERIYEVNQVPAVMAGKMVHPNLYDRLLAAGVTPAYARPAPPPKFSWVRSLAMVLLSVSVFIGVTRFINNQDAKQSHRRHKTTQWTEPRNG